MEKNRLLELALQELIRQKARIDEDIEAIRAEFGGTSVASKQTSHPSAATRRGRKRTPAERRAHSEKMKAYWAAKRAKGGTKAAASARK